MAAISLWMLALSVMGVAGVLSGHYPSGGGRVVILFLCTVFAVAALGLIRLRRWGWALTLGAVFLCMCFGCYSLFRFHQGQIQCAGKMIDDVGLRLAKPRGTRVETF